MRFNPCSIEMPKLFWVVVLIVVGLSLAASGSGSAATALLPTPSDPMTVRCRADLAGRTSLKQEEITLLREQKTLWSDDSLGLPATGVKYNDVPTPGYKVILQAGRRQYLYTTGPKGFKFGGQVALWSASALYVLPVADEANLNGDLHQCSLLGTHDIRLVSGVASFYPQADGMIIFTRRTSRSSHDLLLTDARKPGEAVKLQSAMAFGDAAMNAAGNRWAAYARKGLGSSWRIVVGQVGKDGPVQELDLPAGLQAGRIAWEGDKLMVLDGKNSMVCFEMVPGDAASAWKKAEAHTFPGLKSYSLNKSETLEIDGLEKDGKPYVEVASVWFTGDRNVLATIKGLKLQGYDLLVLPDYDRNPAGFVIIWGEKEGKSAAFSVDISTGEVTPGYLGSGRDIRPFGWRPAEPPFLNVMAD